MKYNSFQRAKIWQNILIYAALVMVSIFMLLPLYYLFTTSFKTLQESIGKFAWLPNQWNFDSYKYVLDLPKFNLVQAFGNTMFIYLAKTVGSLITCTLAAYGFARYNYKYKELIFMILMGVMMIPGEILTIPFYEMYLKMGLMDTYVPLYLSCFFATDIFMIFLFRQFFVSVPTSLFEAARIDGCGEWRALFRIMLPLSKPVIVTMLLLYFSGTYNDIYGPTLYIMSDAKRTVAQTISGVETIFATGSADSIVPYNYVAAATMLSIIPMFIAFFAGQKFFVEGVSTSGIKG